MVAAVAARASIGQAWVPIKQAFVIVTWRGRGRLPDLDNIGGKTKAFIDGLTDAKVWDDDAAITDIVFRRERVASNADRGVWIDIAERKDSAEMDRIAQLDEECGL
jgi:Holliday junction resolvase RusA-like endonuclease